MAITTGPYRFGFACVEKLSDGAEAAGIELARSARSAVGTQPTPYAALLIFADGLTAEHQAIVSALHLVAGTAVPVVGGGAGDDRGLSKTLVFYDDRVLSDAAVGVWIGSDQPVSVVSATVGIRSGFRFW